jgi:predicted nucleic acid-binding protein
MKFWDTSAIIALVLKEEGTPIALDQHAYDREIVVWWGTRLECVTAFARLERERVYDIEALHSARYWYEVLASRWHEILPTEAVRSTAERLVQVHPLKAGDAFQLAAAIHAANQNPENLPFITFDQQLGKAARGEGFPAIGIA